MHVVLNDSGKERRETDTYWAPAIGLVFPYKPCKKNLTHGSDVLAKKKKPSFSESCRCCGCSSPPAVPHKPSMCECHQMSNFPGFLSLNVTSQAQPLVGSALMGSLMRASCPTNWKCFYCRVTCGIGLLPPHPGQGLAVMSRGAGSGFRNTEKRLQKHRKQLQEPRMASAFPSPFCLSDLRPG